MAQYRNLREIRLDLSLELQVRCDTYRGSMLVGLVTGHHNGHLVCIIPIVDCVREIDGYIAVDVEMAYRRAR